MGKVCVEKTTGRVREWVRSGEPSVYDPMQHDVIEAEVPPPDGTRWNGTAWVPLPPKTSAEQDAALQAFLDSPGGLVMKAMVTALVKKGIVTIAELRSEWRALS